jgi:hypothetical protein
MSFAAGDPPMVSQPQSTSEPQTGLLFAILNIAFSICLWSVAAFQIVFVIPRFVKIFADFRMSVPIVTQIVIDHSMWIVPVMMLVTFMLCAVVRSRWLWILLLIGVPVFVNLAIIVNLYYPQMLLLEGLAGGGKK